MLYKIISHLPQPIKVLVLTAILLVLLPVSEADALDGISLGVAPALIPVEAEKGGLYTYPVTVFNHGLKPVSVSITFQDFQLDPYGKVRFIPVQSKKQSWSASTWLSVPSHELSLNPGEEKDVPVTVKPPRDAEAGTHRAIISFGTTAAKTRNGGIPIRAGVSTLVLVSVAGKTQVNPHLDMEIPGFVLSAPTIDLSVSNSGNVHVFTDGQVRIMRRNGTSLFTRALKTPKQGALVLPKAKRDFKIEWKAAPYFGLFTAEAKAKLSGGKELVVQENFVLVRWQLLLALFVFILLGVGAYLLSTRFRLVKRADGRPGIQR